MISCSERCECKGEKVGDRSTVALISSIFCCFSSIILITKFFPAISSFIRHISMSVFFACSRILMFFVCFFSTFFVNSSIFFLLYCSSDSCSCNFYTSCWLSFSCALSFLLSSSDCFSLLSHSIKAVSLSLTHEISSRI